MPESIFGTENGDAVSLEQKYIRLLEQKIEQLEKDLANQINEHEQEREKEKSAAAIKRQSILSNGDEGQEAKDGTKKEDDLDNGTDKIEETADEEKPVLEAEENNPRVRLLDSRWQEKTGTFEEVPSQLPPKNKGSEPTLPYAFTWLRKFDETRKYTTTKVTIDSPSLEKLIRETCRVSASSNFKNLTPNFEQLIWNWDDLIKASEEREGETEEAKQARMDLELLLDKVKSSSELQSYFEKRDQWIENKEIAYDWLWTLFPPGEMVCSKVIFDQQQAFIGREHTYATMSARNGTEKNIFWLSCWAYDWNGENFNRVSGRLKIDKYTGAKSINTLKFYPMQYHVDGDGNPAENTLRTLLKKRGEKFRKYCTMPKGQQLFYCDGPVISKQGTFNEMTTSNDSQYDDASTIGSPLTDGGGSGSWSNVKGAVIVDHLSFIQCGDVGAGAMGAFELSDDSWECTCSDCKKSRSLKNMMKFHYDGVKPGETFEEDQLIICPARFLGYVMGTKAWAQMPVDSVQEIKQKIKVDAFSNLILDRNAKTLIKSLVGNHEKKKQSTDGEKGVLREDWIEGKGRGLVILLHGPPGVGKTSTAESVAQATGKPLFTVSVSDIGLEPDQVETKMATIFNLASRWEAVLLFDEADVFLESRGFDKGDLNRNSLVTVFLRILEYYDGILILTTNRIKSFDIAVQSRVHLAIRYKELSTEELRELFLKFVKQYSNEILDVNRVKDWIKEDFDEEIDGRQIRNVMSSARAMAKAEDNSSGKVRLEDIKSVLRMTVQFQKHLRDQRVAARRDQVVDK